MEFGKNTQTVNPTAFEPSSISFGETMTFICINLIIIGIGVFFWNILWIKPKLSEIIKNIGNTITYYSSKDFNLVFSEINSAVTSFDQITLLNTIGFESYCLLLFQRRVMTLIFYYLLVSIILSLISMIIDTINGEETEKFTNFVSYFANNNSFDRVTNVIHIIVAALFTFLHFRCFSMVKEEAKYIYFRRFDRMSQNFNEEWLSCRTLHISGINPEERNTSLLQTKLNYLLNQNNSGHVIDINFIPNYRDFLYYEKKRKEIQDLRLLVTKSRRTCRRFCFSSIYWSERTVEEELNKIENKLDKLTEEPVYSSGHAFICFDSLTAAYSILEMFHKNWLRNLKVKFMSLFDFNKQKKKIDAKGETFQQFTDEFDAQNFQLSVQDLTSSKIKILVDQLIEPCDIIWYNIGLQEGINRWKRILLTLIIWAILLFLTTPAYLFTTLKRFDKFKVLEFNWFIHIPYGYLMVTYCVPLVILLINLSLISLIEYIARLEKHPTHYKYQVTVFNRSFIYITINCLIIPAIGLNSESLYVIIKTNYKNIFQLLSQIFLTNSGYFFITLLVQNGTINTIFYMLRLNELASNAFSTQITFYLRHFINIGKHWQRNESDCFLFGYFYAQYLVFYTICLIFSSTAPIICLAGLYLFVFRHYTDFTSFLMVHGQEIDTNGKLINHILNRTCIPILLYQLFLISVFLYKEQYSTSIIIFVFLIISIIYIYRFNSEYLLDIYSLHSQLSHYEDKKEYIDNNSLNKWRNKFGHPLVIPVFVDKTEENDKFKNKIEKNNLEESIKKENKKEKLSPSKMNSEFEVKSNIPFNSGRMNENEVYDGYQ